MEIAAHRSVGRMLSIHHLLFFFPLGSLPSRCSGTFRCETVNAQAMIVASELQAISSVLPQVGSGYIVVGNLW
jgi:hypothetical protein